MMDITPDSSIEPVVPTAAAGEEVISVSATSRSTSIIASPSKSPSKSSRKTSLSPKRSVMKTASATTDITSPRSPRSPNNRRQVKFGAKKSISPVLRRDEYSPKELEASFYSPKELEEIRDDFLGQMKHKTGPARGRNIPNLPFGQDNTMEQEEDNDKTVTSSPRHRRQQQQRQHPQPIIRPTASYEFAAVKSNNTQSPRTRPPPEDSNHRRRKDNKGGRRVASLSPPRRSSGSLSLRRWTAEPPSGRQAPARMASDGNLSLLRSS